MLLESVGDMFLLPAGSTWKKGSESTIHVVFREVKNGPRFESWRFFFFLLRCIFGLVPSEDESSPQSSCREKHPKEDHMLHRYKFKNICKKKNKNGSKVQINVHSGFFLHQQPEKIALFVFLCLCWDLRGVSVPPPPAVLVVSAVVPVVMVTTCASVVMVTAAGPVFVLVVAVPAVLLMAAGRGLVGVALIPAAEGSWVLVGGVVMLPGGRASRFPTCGPLLGGQAAV